MLNRIFTLLSLAVIILFSASDMVSAQGFNSITTPDGTNIIAAGNAGKLYRSANGGIGYSSYTISGTSNIYSVTSFGNDVWMAGDNGNVIKTLKTASSNTFYNVGDAAPLKSVFFINSNTGFVCGPSGRVYKSVNGGVNWTQSNSGITAGNGNLNSVSFKDENNGTIVANSGSIFVTSDGGDNWDLETSGTTNNLLKVKYSGTGRVAAGEFGTLLIDNGSGWTSINTRTRSDIRGIAGSDMNEIHVCGGGGFIRNNKSGSSNFYNFEKNPMMANLTDIFFSSVNNGWAVSSLNSVIIYTTDGGVTWSMPAGSTISFNWVSKPGASGNFLGNNICLHPTDRNTVFVVFGGQVYVSRNRGENWSAVGATIPATSTPHSFFVSPLDTNIWLVATQSSPDKVYRTTNYGASWTQVISQNFSSYGQPLEIDQNNPSVFYFAPDGGGFWKSTNSGETFSEISGNYPFRSPCEILVTWDSSNVIIVGDGTTGSGRAVIFRSINGGVNWTPIDTVSSDGSETPSMCNTVFEKNVIYSTEWSGSDIYKSTDYGADFTLSHNTGIQGWGSDISREDPTMIITGGWSAAARLSTDGGVNWININTGLSGHGGGILIAERGLVIAQQGSNVYKLNIAYTDTPVLSSIDVQVLSLGGTGSQFYPTTTITPTGTVKNNNQAANATFNVTRRISPGGYVSTKTVTNLASSGSATVNFDPWTFSAGTVYTVKDSVHIDDDVNAANDVLSGSITPYLGISVNTFTEQFAPTFPPSGWVLAGTTGTMYWIYSPLSSYGNGTGSALYNFWNSPAGRNQTMSSPTFTASVSGDKLSFDYAYAPFTSDTDSLLIQISSNGGASYTNLTKLYGKNGYTGDSTLNTAPTTSSEFFPASDQWLTKNYTLPAGTNKVRFRARSGFGNNLFVDNVNISSVNLFTQYNIKLAPEGMYNGTTLNLADTVKAYLRNTNSPFNNVDSSVAVIDPVSLNAAFVFKNAPTGTYYIQIVHRNSVETWSKAGGEALTKGVTANYDFTSAQTQTYGNNSILISGKWCLYAGDVVRNGIVELADVLEIYNNASNFTSGYILSDLTGEGTVDLSDILIAYNNSSDFIAKITPETILNPDFPVKENTRIRLWEFQKSGTIEGNKTDVRK